MSLFVNISTIDTKYYPDTRVVCDVESDGVQVRRSRVSLLLISCIILQLLGHSQGRAGRMTT